MQHDVRVPLHQLLRLLLQLHAFGHHPQAQTTGNQQHGLDHGCIPVGAVTATHKALVDLDLMDRQMLEAVHGRIARAKVVQRYLYAHIAQLLQQVAHLMHIAKHHPLGDLQRELMRIGPGLMQHCLEHGHELLMPELDGADIDRQPQASLHKGRLRQQHAGLTHHPFAQAHDQLGLLGHGNELNGADQPPLRMLPAHQRLGTYTLSIGRSLGLQEQPQLALRDAVAQVPGNAHALDQLLDHARLEQQHAARTDLLGLVQGDAGKAQHIAVAHCIGPGLHHGSAHGAADGLHSVPAQQLERALHRFFQRAGILVQLLFRTGSGDVQVLEKQSELRRCDAPYPDIIGQDLHQPRTDGMHQLIAVLHAMRIAKERKAVHIQQQQTMADTPLAVSQGPQMQRQRMAVGQAGQGVQIHEIMDAPGCQHFF